MALVAVQPHSYAQRPFWWIETNYSRH